MREAVGEEVEIMIDADYMLTAAVNVPDAPGVGFLPDEDAMEEYKSPF